MTATIWIGYEGADHEGYGEPEIAFTSKDEAHRWAILKPHSDASDWREVIEFPVTGGASIEIGETFGNGHSYRGKQGELSCERCIQQACDHAWSRMPDNWIKPKYHCTKCNLYKFFDTELGQ